MTSAFQDDFSIAYIYHHSNRDLPAPYKFATLWSGQEGSLLFWSLLLAAYGLVLRLRHKTSDRGFHKEALAKAGTYEVVFVNGEGFVTEGSFTNIFVERGGKLLTPPLSRGLMPGVLRRQLIEEGRSEEADLRPSDLRDGLFIGNAVRGLIAAKLVD